MMMYLFGLAGGFALSTFVGLIVWPIYVARIRNWVKAEAETNARAEAAEMAWDAARTRAEAAELCEKQQREWRVAAESEAAALRAEVERLRAEVAIAWDDAEETDRANRAESRLAAANALLGRVSHWQNFAATWDEFVQQIADHLAAQPATAPTRAEAEQAVR